MNLILVEIIDGYTVEYYAEGAGRVRFTINSTNYTGANGRNLPKAQYKARAIVAKRKQIDAQPRKASDVGSAVANEFFNHSAKSNNPSTQ